MNLLDEIQDLRAQSAAFSPLCQDLVRLLRQRVPHYSWVGIYMIEGSELVLTAWDGPAATQHVRIPIGQGICGLAAREARTVVVDDVNKDPRYLQCFLNTRAEIVVPIFKNGKVIGEIDIDSDRVGVFNEADRLLLEWTAEQLAKKLPINP